MENTIKKTSILQFEQPKYTFELVKSLFEQSNNNSERFTQLLNAHVRNFFKNQEGMTEEILEQAKITEVNAKALAKQGGLTFKKKSFKQTLVLDMGDKVNSSLINSIPTLGVEEEPEVKQEELFGDDSQNDSDEASFTEDTDSLFKESDLSEIGENEEDENDILSNL